MKKSPIEPDSAALETLLDQAQRVVEAFEPPGPEDDWPTMAVIGRLDQPDFGLDFYELSFTDQEEKDQIFNRELPEIIVESQAQIMLLILPSWRIALEPGEANPSPGLPPSQHPNRQEIVFLTAYTRKASESRSVDVQRFPDRRPELAGWLTIGKSSEQKVTGTLVAASLSALRPT